MEHIQLIETVLYVNDQQASADFYTKIFRRNPDLNVPGMTEFRLAENFYRLSQSRKFLVLLKKN